MWEKGRVLAACMFAAAWWSIFYPELCFSEGTCETVWSETAEEEAGQTAVLQGREAGEAGQGAETDTASGIMRAKDDEIVISSRLFEWCEERLFDRKE